MCVEPIVSSSINQDHAISGSSSATLAQKSSDRRISSSNPKSFVARYQLWVEDRQRQIDRLNERVQVLTQKAIVVAAAQQPQKSKNSSNSKTSNSKNSNLAPEFVHAQQKMTVLTAGTPVYQLRCAPVVFLYTLIAIGLLVAGVVTLFLDEAQKYESTTSNSYSNSNAASGSSAALAVPVLLQFVVCVLVMFVGYDFYSGVLHVVFDHPSNIQLPLLGQPCLEFQWHHSIPDDIVRKDFCDVCGDLNVVIGLLIGLNVFLLPLDNGVALLLGGTKLLMAYFGQYSHKSAHCVGKAVTPTALFLQNKGVMVSQKRHLSHHVAPYSLDFCLVGLCNPIIDFLRTVSTSNAVWLTVFLIWSVVDIYVMQLALTRFFAVFLVQK